MNTVIDIEDNLLTYTIDKYSLTYRQGVFWKTKNINNFDRLYTGKVETDIPIDSFFHKPLLLHFYGYMESGIITNITFIGYQYNSWLNYKLFKLLRNKLYVTTLWRPYGQFI